MKRRYSKINIYKVLFYEQNKNIHGYQKVNEEKWQYIFFRLQILIVAKISYDNWFYTYLYEILILMF